MFNWVLTTPLLLQTVKKVRVAKSFFTVRFRKRHVKHTKEKHDFQELRNLINFFYDYGTIFTKMFVH